jgi:hypothetical protein
MSRILQICESYVGITERPARSNRTVLGARYGQNGVPWCGISVAMAYQDAGIDLRKVLTKNMASTVEILRAAKKKKWFRPAREAAPTDIVLFHMPGGRRGVNHVGIVKSVGSSGITTYEGNTSQRGSQFAGGGYMVKTRPWSLVLGVVKVPFASQLGGAGSPPVSQSSPPAVVSAAPSSLPIRKYLGAKETGRLVEIAQWEISAVSGYQFPPASTGKYDLHLVRAVIDLGKILGENWTGSFIGPEQWKAIDFLYLRKGHQPVLR